MTLVLTIPAARQHLRVGSEISDDALTDYIAAAEALLSDFLERPLVDELLGWPTPEEVPANVVHGIKLVLTDLYDNRATPLEDMTALRALCGRHMAVSFG